MAKISLTDLANLQNENTAVNAINANNAILEAASDNTLSRDGTSPNEMESVLDMNSHQIVNLPTPSTENSPLRLKDLADFWNTGVINTLPDGGTTGQILTKISNADYDADWQNSSGLDNQFIVSNYATAQDAINAAIANNGGTVIFDEDYTIPVGGLNISGITKPIRLTSYANEWSGPASLAVNITYGGTGRAIDARGAWYLEIDHLAIFANNGGCQKIIDMGEDAGLAAGAVGCHVHHCTISTTVSTTGCIGINLDNSQFCRINNNVIAITEGIGVQGLVPTTGLWSVKNLIEDNLFTAANDTAINNPGQTWTIANNVFNGGNTAASLKKIIRSGNPGRVDTLNFTGNWMGDFTAGAGNPLVQVNADVFLSQGNTYANAAGGICIEMDASSGSVISIGDRLEGDVGIDVNTGNYLTIIQPDQGHLPTTLYSGTPASSLRNFVNTGITELVGQVNTGSSNGTIGLINMFNGTAGVNYTTLVPASGATGGLSMTLPSQTTTLVGTNNTATLTNKTINATNNTVSNFPVLVATNNASAVNYIPFLSTNSGDLPLRAGTNTSSLTINPAIPSVGIGSPASTIALLTVSGGGATLTGTTQFAMNLQPTLSAACTTQGVGLYVAPSTIASAFTMTVGNGIYIDNGTKGAGSTVTTYQALRIASPTIGTTNYSIYSLGGRNYLAGGLALGTDVDPGNGALQTSSSIKSTSASAGVGYATGAGGTVTQLTSKSTAVTLNAVTGAITMNNASLAANTSVGFNLTNSAIAVTDVVIVNIKSGNTVLSYSVTVDSISAGSCFIHLRNITAGALAEAVTLQFAVIKGVNS